MNNKYTETEVSRVIKVLRNVDGPWSWAKYLAGPYLGCSFACAYCYNLDNNESDAATIKKDAVEKFRSELKELPKDVITLGDYQPVEEEKRLIRSMLKIVAAERWPLHIIEKSPLVVNDLDIIEKISREAWTAVSISVTSSPAEPKTAANVALFEPDTAAAAKRFAIMAKVAAKGILTGAYCVPVIPFIGDSPDTIEAVIKATKEAGGKYFILGGLVIPEPFDQLFWETIIKYFPRLETEMKELYDINNGVKYLSYLRDLEAMSTRLCEKYDLQQSIPRPIEHYPKKLHDNKLIAEHFYLAARYAGVNGLPVEKEDEYMTLAFLLDSFDNNICSEYKDKGFKVLEELGLTQAMSKELETQISSRL